MDVYTSTNWYPGIDFAKGSYKYLRGAKIFVVNLFPLQYKPSSGKLMYYTDFTVNIETVDVEPPQSIVSYRNTFNDNQIIKDFVHNPEHIIYYQNNVPLGDKSQPLDDTQTYQYVVITNENLYTSFQTLTDWKNTQYGLTTYIETVENIYANYSGEDNPAKIRNFIKDAYTAWETEYIVLGGDADGANDDQNAVVPHRGLYGYVGSYSDNDIASDLYFGCLDGDFDYDGDGIYGETGDGESGGDVDMLYDVYVGRICAQTATEAINHINKIINYENDAAPYKALLIGQKLDSLPTWGGDYKDAVYEYMNEMPKTTLYERDGTYSKSAVINAINSNTHSIVNHMGHANVTNNMGMNTGDTASLNNTIYLWAYTQGCYCGSFDNRNTSSTSYNSSDCIGEYFTAKHAPGFAAYIGNSRYGWYSPGSTNGTSNIFDMEIMKSVFQKDIMNIGHSLADSKESLIGNAGSNGAYRWVYFELNLLGCPHMPIELNCPEDILMIKEVYPPENFVVYKNSSVNVKAKIINGCGDYVTGLNVTASFSTGDSQITLNYIGNGFYGGYWSPQALGQCSITIDVSGAAYSGDSEVVNGSVTDVSYCCMSNDAEYDWIDATGGTPLGLDTEDIKVIDIGFNFSYYGSSYSQVGVSSNGYIKFGTPVNDWENQCIPDILEPNNLIALYWDDLDPDAGSGEVYYQTFGTSPERYLVVEWHDVYRFGLYSGTPGTFEVIIYEGSNNIKFQYMDTNFGYSSYNYGASATIGIESDGGTLAYLFSCNDAVLTDEMAILIEECDDSNEITLEWFKAKPVKDAVMINWKTGTEIDTLGFYIVKSEQAESGYSLVNDIIIPATGNTYSGQTYEYVDTNVESGKVYYYWLIDVDMYGSTKIHGPSKAVTFLLTNRLIGR